MRKLKYDIWPHTVILYNLLPDRAWDPITLRWIPAVVSRDKIEKWCLENCGHRFKDWYSYADNNNVTYAFKDTETLLTFKLIWGNYAKRNN
jgi:hypothetical protein